MTNDSISEFTDSSEEVFIAALFGEDELGVVVRAHIHIEATLLELLNLLVVDPKYLERMELDYAQRVNLAIALGLDSSHASALSTMGTLRNAFAHKLGTELSESRVKNLYKTLSESDKKVVQNAYELTKSQAGIDGKSFGNLTRKERFILISVALRAALRLAIKEIRDTKTESAKEE